MTVRCCTRAVLLALALSAGSATKSAERPLGETTFRQDRLAYFSDNVDYDFYMPVSTAADTLDTPPVARMRYVWSDAPGYRNAQVVGGLPALRVALSREMRGFTCPVRGRVVVEAMIDANGTAVLPIVAGSLHPDCDARVLRAFMSMSCTAGRVQGRPVAMPLTLPVTIP